MPGAWISVETRARAGGTASRSATSFPPLACPFAGPFRTTRRKGEGTSWGLEGTMRHAPRPAAYQPHLEFLEARLPPGDVLLGATLGALLTGPTLSQESFVSAGDVRPLRRTLSGIDVL